MEQRPATRLADHHELVGADVVGVHNQGLVVLVKVGAQLCGGQERGRASATQRTSYNSCSTSARLARTLASYFSFFWKRDMVQRRAALCVLLATTGPDAR